MQSVVVTRQLGQNATLSGYWSIVVPALTHGHQVWGEITDKSWCRVAGLSLRVFNHPGETQSRVPATSHLVEPLEVVQACGEDAPLDASPSRGVLGMSN